MPYLPSLLLPRGFFLVCAYRRQVLSCLSQLFLSHCRAHKEEHVAKQKIISCFQVTRHKYSGNDAKHSLSPLIRCKSLIFRLYSSMALVSCFRMLFRAMPLGRKRIVHLRKVRLHRAGQLSSSQVKPSVACLKFHCRRLVHVSDLLARPDRVMQRHDVQI